MKKEISKFIVMTMVLGLVVSLATFSFSNEGKKDGDEGSKIINMKEKLALSDNQIAKIQAIQANSGKNLDNLMQKQEDDTEILSAKIKDGSTDTDLKPLLAVFQSNSIKIMDARKDVMKKIQSILTPTQQAQEIAFKSGTNEVKKEWNDSNRIDAMTTDLDLNDNQVARIKSVFSASKKSIDMLMQRKQTDEKALNVKLEAGLSDNELKPLVDVIRTDMIKIEDSKRNEMDQVRIVLSPTQQAKDIVARNEKREKIQGNENVNGNDKDHVNANDNPSYNTNYNPKNNPGYNTNNNPIMNTNININTND